MSVSLDLKDISLAELNDSNYIAKFYDVNVLFFFFFFLSLYISAVLAAQYK